MLGLRISLYPSLGSCGSFTKEENFVLHLITIVLVENWHVSKHFVLRYLALFNWFWLLTLIFVAVFVLFLIQ